MHRENEKILWGSSKGSFTWNSGKKNLYEEYGILKDARQLQILSNRWDYYNFIGTTTATFSKVLLILAFFQFGQNIWSTKIQVLRISLQTLGSENYVQ